MEKLPRLPLEVLMLIMYEVDSKPTMLACCRLCHTLKDEAEKVLYCNITLFLASQVRRLLQALNRIPRRASFVRYLSVQDRDCGHTGIVSAISTVNEIIPRLSKLEHLVLEAAAWTRNPGLFDSVLSTLNTCDFALVSFEPRCIKFAQRELLTFLSRQPTITFLNLHFLGYNPARVAFPHGALPRLKYLDTTVDCFMTTLRAPRSITHLSLNRLNILMKDLKRVLRIVGHQLVSLKYDPPAKSPPLGPVAPPIFPFKIADMPRLRFLDVIEIMHDNFNSCFVADDDDVFTPVTRPNIVLHTLVWRLIWPVARASSYERERREQYAYVVAESLFLACATLRQVFYAEPKTMPNPILSRRYMLKEDGLLDIQPMYLPDWRSV